MSHTALLFFIDKMNLLSRVCDEYNTICAIHTGCFSIIQCVNISHQPLIFFPYFPIYSCYYKLYYFAIEKNRINLTSKYFRFLSSFSC